MFLAKFIETELNAYIEDQRLTDAPLVVQLISKAFEAYDEYKRLTSQHKPECQCVKDEAPEGKLPFFGVKDGRLINTYE